MTRLHLLLLGFFVALSFASTPSGARAQDSDEVEQLTVRPGEGVRFRSADGRHGFGVSGLLQLWGTANEGTDEVTFGAQVRRARVGITAHLFGEDNRLTLSLGTPGDERLDGAPDPTSDFGIVDAFIGFHQLRDFEVRIGRQLVPLMREWITLAPALSMPERSRAARRWHRGRRLGITFGSDDFLGTGRIRYRAGAFMGDLIPSGALPISLMARVDVSILGNTRLDQGGDLSRSPTPRLSLGGGYMLLLNEAGLGGDMDQQDASIDLVFRLYGLSIEGSFLWTKVVFPDSAAESQSDIGGTAAVTYLLPWFNLEAGIRYSGSTGSLGGTDFLEHEWTGALSYYIAGDHTFKVQAAVIHSHVDDEDGLFSGILSLQGHL